MGVYITTLILLNTDLTSDEQNITKHDAPLFRVSIERVSTEKVCNYGLTVADPEIRPGRTMTRETCGAVVIFD